MRQPKMIAQGLPVAMAHFGRFALFERRQQLRFQNGLFLPLHLANQLMHVFAGTAVVAARELFLGVWVIRD